MKLPKSYQFLKARRQDLKTQSYIFFDSNIVNKFVISEMMKGDEVGEKIKTFFLVTPLYSRWNCAYCKVRIRSWGNFIFLYYVTVELTTRYIFQTGKPRHREIVSGL